MQHTPDYMLPRDLRSLPAFGKPQTAPLVALAEQTICSAEAGLHWMR